LSKISEMTTDTFVLPEELLRYLNRRSCSLLIKGSAGSGKTTLALTLLKALTTDENFLYLSTRASPAQLFGDYPWLSVEFSSGAVTSGPGARANPRFIDARLDEPGQLFERIASELMDVRTPTIVIDTWNSMEDYADFEDLRINVRVLQSWIERVGGKLILLGEDSEDSTIDALVDGIVVLKQGELDARRVREMSLVKLRGMRIQSPVYNFTLKDGFFRAFPHSRVEDLLQTPRIPWRPIPGSDTARSGYISTGYAELDLIHGGGLSKGTLAEIEMGQGLDPKMAMLFLLPLLNNFLASGGRAKIVPWPGANRSFMAKLLATLPAHQRRRVQVLQGNPNKKGSRVPPTGGDSTQHPSGSDAGLSILFVGPDQTRIEPKAQGWAETEKSLMIVVTPHGKASTSTWNAEARVKLLFLNGTLFIESEVPYSELHAIVHRGSGKFARVHLEQIS
jgi:KaiC/GvpD/RAD55 family RecA-like ATPase